MFSSARLRMSLPSALCLFALAVAPAFAHQVVQVSDTAADSHSCRVAAAPDNTFVVAWVEDGSGVWTRTYSGLVPAEPVFHGAGTMPDLDWAPGIGYVLAWNLDGDLILRESWAAGPDGWSDTMTGFGAPGAFRQPRVMHFRANEWVHGCYVAAATDQGDVYLLETDETGAWSTQPQLVWEGDSPGDGWLAQALHRGATWRETRLFFMTQDGLVYCDRAGDIWQEPQELLPGFGYFGGDFAVDRDPDGVYHVLSNGPTPTCPCNVIHYSYGTGADDWSLPEDLTFYADEFTWPQSPAVGIGDLGEPWLAWFQQHYGMDMMPSDAGTYFCQREGDAWTDHATELQGHFGADTDLHVGLAWQSALVWAEGGQEPRDVWMALAPQVTAGDPAPPAALALSAQPNPFNPMTTLRVQLASASALRIVVTGVDGRALRTLADGRYPAGEQLFDWDGRDGAGRALASGVYLARATSSAGRTSSKLVLLR